MNLCWDISGINSSKGAIDRGSPYIIQYNATSLSLLGNTFTKKLNHQPSILR